MLDRPPSPVEPSADYCSFEHHEDAVEQSPYDEVPARAVPETGDGKYYQEVYKRTRARFSISSKGDVDIEICHLRQNSLMEREMYG